MTDIKNADQPAFPYAIDKPNLVHLDIKPGLTKREYIAAMMAQGIMANFKRSGSIQNVVEYAVLATDKLLVELEKEPSATAKKDYFGLHNNKQLEGK